MKNFICFLFVFIFSSTMFCNIGFSKCNFNNTDLLDHNAKTYYCYENEAFNILKLPKEQKLYKDFINMHSQLLINLSNDNKFIKGGNPGNAYSAYIIQSRENLQNIIDNHLQNKSQVSSQKNTLRQCHNEDTSKRNKCYQKLLYEIIDNNIFEGYINVYINGVVQKQYDNRKSDFKKLLKNNLDTMETFFTKTSIQQNLEDTIEIYYLELLNAFNNILKYYES